jgi:hypothetical protein
MADRAPTPFDRYLDEIRQQQDEAARQPLVQPAGTAPGSNPLSWILNSDPRSAPERFVADPRVQSAMRFTAGVLSPVQAPQDIAFAITAGALNPYRTVGDYLQQLEWANYTPWTRAPIRPVSGDQILRLAGVRDENTIRYLGIAMDLVADPLLAGTMVRSIGRVARLGANAERVAGVLDTMAQSTMLVGGVPTARVLRAARSLPGFSQGADAVMDGVVRRHVVPFLQRTVERVEIPLPRGGTTSPAGFFFTDGGRIPEARQAVAQIAAAGEELVENSAVYLMQAMAAAGDPRWQRHLRSLIEAQAVLYDIPVPLISRFKPETSRAIFSRAYQTAEDIGALGFIRRLDDIPAPGPQMQRAQRHFAEIADVMTEHRLPREVWGEMSVRKNRYIEAHQDLRRAAERFGDNPELVSQAFDGVLESFQKASALEGYFASGYGILHDQFIQNAARLLGRHIRESPTLSAAVRKAGGEATVVREAWRDLLRAGAEGRANELLREPVRFAGQQLMAQQGAVRHAATYADLFGEFKSLPGLSLGTWLDSLPRGHMRRAFGVFQDDDSWRLAASALREGRLSPTRLLDEQRVFGELRRSFPEETRLIQEYIDGVMPKARPGRPMGGFVTQNEVVEYLVRQGVEPEKAALAWRRMSEIADPEIAQLARDLQRYGAMTVGDVPGRDPAAFMGARGMFSTARQDIPQEHLAMLMELMDPVISRAETAIGASRALRKTETMAELYQIARRRGLVLDPGDAPSWWRAVPVDQAHAYPMFAGKMVPPMLMREVNNLLAHGKQPNMFVQGANTLRSMVTAGFLANPATTTANVAGGFWTAALMGVNPVKLMREMVGTWQDWTKMGRNLPELAHMRDILEGGISSSDLIRHAGRLRVERLNLGTTGGLEGGIRAMGTAISEGVQRYNQLLLRPLGGQRGSGVLGLGAFTLSESLFRMGMFRMARKGGASIEEARRLARFVVFDYTAQPGMVQWARDTGVFLFPAFPYFMMGRTLSAAVRNPGTLAVGDRMAEFVWNLNVQDDDTRLALYGGMTDWMREDKFVPVREKEGGDYSLLSLNQLMPTVTLTGRPFSDSLTSLGLWGPLLDMVGAWVGQGSMEDPGQAALTGRFGRRVYSPEVAGDPAGMLRQTLAFAYNSYAPGIARKLYRPSEDPTIIPDEGFIPNLARMLQPTPPEWGDTGRNIHELIRRRADQDLLDSALSLTIRATRTLATEGDLAEVGLAVNRAQTSFNRQIAWYDNRIALNEASPIRSYYAQLLRRRREQYIQDWHEEWDPIIAIYDQLRQQGRFRR